MNKPVILGGLPFFLDPLPITKPYLPKLEDIIDELRDIFESGEITNSKYVERFEEEVAEYLGVKHAVAVSSCTTGLILAQKVLNLTGEVIVPSFTFSATAHSLMWNNLVPIFTDCELATHNLDPELIEAKITSRTSAILATYVFGNPPRIEKLETLARRYSLKLIFDAAHAMGSKYNGKSAGGFGDVEVFSLSPTKLLVTGEGGLVTTNDDEVARKIRIGRNYGNPGNYDCQFIGLNGRMTEFNAILGLKGLQELEQNVKRRNELTNFYKSLLSTISGINFQKITINSRSSYKDFSISIHPQKFGLTRDQLAHALEWENIATKKYFYPPVHLQKVYSQFYKLSYSKLAITEGISRNVLCLPIYSHMTEEEVIRVYLAVKRIYESGSQIQRLIQENLFKSEHIVMR